MSFHKENFDTVICLGVFLHTLDPQNSFRIQSGFVKPSGALVVDVYRKYLPALLQRKYLLQPQINRTKKEAFYSAEERAAPLLMPAAALLTSLAGRIGARLSPIVECSSLGLSAEQNRQFSILDTFDMYSPAYDRLQSMGTVQCWSEEVGLTDIEVGWGTNGVIGRGRKPRS